MKHRLLYTLGLIVLVMVAFSASPAGAQTVAPGPYYATPSWDQQLPAFTRFIVLSNWGGAAVLDRETGLVWEKSPSTAGVNWGGAHRRCNQLYLGNRKGWRLPTLQELTSLVDPSVPSPGPTLPPGHPFSNVQTFYWSATSDADYPATEAWYVLIGYVIPYAPGQVGVHPKDWGQFVWCVRGGQGVDPQ